MTRATKHFALLLLLLTCATSACRSTEENPHVVPPDSPPASADDVVGIWRNVHQGLLELRARGSYVLISPITDPESGTFVLTGDRLEVRAETGCTDAGAYRVKVARARRMDLTDGDDACATRKRVMQSDPWIYTPR